MEIKISKKFFYYLVAIVVVGIGGFAWGKKGATPSVPYAHTSMNDLPAVVGEPTLDRETKIPFTEMANYKEYTPELLASSLASGNATLLFFYADWCSSCKVQEPMNTAFFSKALAENVPIIGIRVDIDDYRDLARQYGINYQHSFVLIDTTGTPVSKFFGEHSAEALGEKVREHLSI